MKVGKDLNGQLNSLFILSPWTACFCQLVIRTGEEQVGTYMTGGYVLENTVGFRVLIRKGFLLEGKSLLCGHRYSISFLWQLEQISENVVA